MCISLCITFLAFQFQESWGITSMFLQKKEFLSMFLFFQGYFPGIPFCRNYVPAKKNLLYPSHQNVTIPQHVDQKQVKDVVHHNTTRNKESWLLLSLAAPLIYCPLHLAKSFIWHVCFLSFHCSLVGCCVTRWPLSASQPAAPPLVSPSIWWLSCGIAL
jgi:hypothetical protein